MTAVLLPNATTIIRSLVVLYPPFRARLEQGLALARQAGLQVYPFETLRTGARQAFLWAQGRTKEGIKITNARPGESWHEYGLAVDLVFDGSKKPGIQWDWSGDWVDDRAGDYAALARVMEQVGLEWLGPKDMPHFQMTGGMSINEARAIREAGGLLAVWLELERRGVI